MAHKNRSVFRCQQTLLWPMSPTLISVCGILSIQLVTNNSKDLIWTLDIIATVHVIHRCNLIPTIGYYCKAWSSPSSPDIFRWLRLLMRIYLLVLLCTESGCIMFVLSSIAFPRRRDLTIAHWFAQHFRTFQTTAGTCRTRPMQLLFIF